MGVQRKNSKKTTKNLCNNLHDKFKVKQMDQLLDHLHLIGKRPSKVKAVVLDSSKRRTSTALLGRCYKAENITLVERNEATAKKHRSSGHHVYEGEVSEFIEQTDEKFNLLYMDTENGSSGALYLFNKILTKNVVDKKCLLFLNFSTRDKLRSDCKKMLGLKRKSGGLTMTEFEKYYSHFLSNSDYKVKKQYSDEYKRENGAPMNYRAILLEKKV